MGKRDRQTHTQRHSERQKERERDKDRQRERERERERERMQNACVQVEYIGALNSPKAQILSNINTKYCCHMHVS